VFSTEGHLLPIDLSSSGQSLKANKLGFVVAQPEKPIIAERDSSPTDSDMKLVPWQEKQSQSGKELGKETLIRMDRRTGQLSLIQGTNQQIPAAVAKLLSRMSDNFSQKSAVINLNNYDNSCPSLEVQEMRFDGRYHPFLNKRIKPPKTTTSLRDSIDQELLFAIGFKVLYSISQ
jgi:hypothetical protein